jgi:pimeloyl-ACP methyl ester carboxylesterase
MPYPTEYHAVRVDGVNVFYREAGSPHAPTLQVLHGFPSSSRMYKGLIAQLALDFLTARLLDSDANSTTAD